MDLPVSRIATARRHAVERRARLQGLTGETQVVHSTLESDPPDSTNMRRQMLRFLQKRKFRLVTRWKAALKDNIGFQLPARRQFPYALIFRAFDELVQLLKSDPAEGSAVHGESFLAQAGGQIPTSADQYMELFLTGRDVLGDFLQSDKAFCSLFSPQDRQNLHSAMERAFKHLIEREMNEYTRLRNPILPG